uniref:Uncharacterized protein n=1 Tax=Trichogramma kaykai TaxID=54128 RepID=A0ABD2VSS8_9HYME
MSGEYRIVAPLTCSQKEESEGELLSLRSSGSSGSSGSGITAFCKLRAEQFFPPTRLRQAAACNAHNDYTLGHYVKPARYILRGYTDRPAYVEEDRPRMRVDCVHCVTHDIH